MAAKAVLQEESFTLGGGGLSSLFWLPNRAVDLYPRYPPHTHPHPPHPPRDYIMLNGHGAATRWPNKRGKMQPSVKWGGKTDKVGEKLITEVSACCPAAAAIRGGGVPVGRQRVSSGGKFLQNIHMIRLCAYAAEQTARLVKVIKEHVKHMSPPHPTASALASLLLMSPPQGPF